MCMSVEETRRVRFLGTGVPDGSEPLCVCKEWNLDHLAEQPVLLTLNY